MILEIPINPTQDQKELGCPVQAELENAPEGRTRDRKSKRKKKKKKSQNITCPVDKITGSLMSSVEMGHRNSAGIDKSSNL